MNRRETDVVVIGAGPVGENVADRVVQGGLEAIIIEAELVGGECSYWACDPSKALLRPGQVLEAARAVPGVASAITGKLDVAAVFARRDAITDGWSDAGQVAWLDSAGIELVRGRGRLSGEREVTVTDADGEQTVITARHAVAVSTGSVAAIPDIPGLAEAKPWSSRDATSAHEVPPRLAVIGGGVVATEMATAFASFGSEVTILARHGLLGGMEDFAGTMLVENFRANGITVHTDTSISRVDRDGDQVVIQTSAGEIIADEVLVATGRAAATSDLGLDNVGLTPGAWLDVDDTLRVHGFDWLYGVGDVNHRALLTHQGKYQARAAGDVIVARATGRRVSDAAWGAHVATADHLAVPQVVFTSPEVASVGLTAAQATTRGLDVRVIDYELGHIAGASLQREHYQGRARAIIDETRQVIVGATFVGPDVAELVQAATMAIVGEIPLNRLWHAVPAFPTVSEVWLRFLEVYGRPQVEA
ncbi:NAD(P)/FAD-dependent oxidoreductase [Microbacterium sp. LWH10-1.2]|uniref:dihydrolipoyl dehydrogenase family protein n=1 Tax=Microbacterium sp. LWH10-1.2 TaxID=3135255 RepID=UPI0031395219